MEASICRLNFRHFFSRLLGTNGSLWVLLSMLEEVLLLFHAYFQDKEVTLWLATFFVRNKRVFTSVGNSLRKVEPGLCSIPLVIFNFSDFPLSLHSSQLDLFLYVVSYLFVLQFLLTWTSVFLYFPKQ